MPNTPSTRAAGIQQQRKRRLGSRGTTVKMLNRHRERSRHDFGVRAEQRHGKELNIALELYSCYDFDTAGLSRICVCDGWGSSTQKNAGTF